MKKLFNKLNSSMLRAQIKMKSFLDDQRGDTNFISIAIILVVVIAIAVLFISLAGDIETKFTAAKNDLLGALGE